MSVFIRFLFTRPWISRGRAPINEACGFNLSNLLKYFRGCLFHSCRLSFTNHRRLAKLFRSFSTIKCGYFQEECGIIENSMNVYGVS